MFLCKTIEFRGSQFSTFECCTAATESLLRESPNLDIQPAMHREDDRRGFPFAFRQNVGGRPIEASPPFFSSSVNARHTYLHCLDRFFHRGAFLIYFSRQKLLQSVCSLYSASTSSSSRYDVISEFKMTSTLTEVTQLRTQELREDF